MTIEVEWKGVAYGMTQIDIVELGCKNEKEWNKLSRYEQKKRINEWQKENEAREFKQIDWWKFDSED